MTGNRWLYKSTLTHLQAPNTDWWWHFYLLEKQQKKKNSCKSVFHICKWWVLMSLRLFCQQWRAHMVPGFHTLARQMERRLLSLVAVCLLWRGVMMGLPCVHASVSEYMRVVVVGCFFSVTAYCLNSGHSRLSTWCLSLHEWLTCLSWWSRSDKTKKVQWFSERLPFVFCLSDAVGIQVVHLNASTVGWSRVTNCCCWWTDKHSLTCQHTYTRAWTGCTTLQLFLFVSILISLGF